MSDALKGLARFRNYPQPPEANFWALCTTDYIFKEVEFCSINAIADRSEEQ